MRKYEITYIVRSDVDEETAKGLFDSMKDMLESKKTKVLEAKELGQKELAYEINKYKNGFYYFFLVEAENTDGIDEFDRLALINDNIIRHLIVRIEK